MKRRIVIDIEQDVPFADAAQEQYVLSTIEDALDTEIWFDMLANEAVAPQRFSKACAHFTNPYQRLK